VVTVTRPYYIVTTVPITGADRRSNNVAEIPDGRDADKVTLTKPLGTIERLYACKSVNESATSSLRDVLRSDDALENFPLSRTTLDI